jgi:cation diffusion facilitator CzcD-associated flavoprotein CzcO
MSTKDNMRIAIIGAGPSGIATGRELLQQGFSNFTIYDKESAAGGTWHMHTYPGLACDVWAHSYTFSYAPNPQWSSTFVTQPEIEQYLQRCAKSFGLEPYMKFKQRIISAKLQEDYRWQLTIDDSGTQRQEYVDVVINCMGNQHTPLYPKLQGLSSDGSDVFAGSSWHSTNWQHDVSLQGKNVVVIGSAAAAIQIIPEIAKEVGHLTILQRSANWIMPRNNKNYSPITLKLFKSFPSLVRGLRVVQGVLMNLVYYAVSNGSRTMNTFENICRKFIEKAIDDP